MTSNLKRLPSFIVAVVIVISIALFLIVSFSIGLNALWSRVKLDPDSVVSIQPSQQPSSLLVEDGNWSFHNDADVFSSKFEEAWHADSNSTVYVNDTRKQFIRPIKVTPVWPMNLEENLPSDEHRSHTPRHHSGNFRRNKAVIWDPHPEYEFFAFGQLFHLILERDSEFTHPSLKVTVVSKNSTIQNELDVNPSGCYYSGFLRNQSNSKVIVSLCNGMTGHIKTENGSYFVEPAEPFDENMDTFLHTLSRLNSDSDADDSHYSVSSIYNETHAHCELLEKHPTSYNNAFPRNRHNNNNNDEDGDNEEDDDDDDEDDDDGEEENDSYGSKSQLGEVTTAALPETVFRRRKKRSAAPETVENIVELMIAIDDGMARYHGSGLQNFVLTLIGMVSKIFKDKSIGNPMRITMTKLVILSDRDIVNIQPSNKKTALQDTLNNFCRWQRVNNDDDDLSQNHHDCALLLSREIKCELRNVNKCYDKLGLAELGTMCQKRCCAVVRDNGLSTAFTIAHELGHTFNMPHDQDKKCTRFIEKGSKKKVMSIQLGEDTHPWKWSPCSRHFLTEFLETGNGFCLHDDPSSDYLQNYNSPHTQQLPGEKYSKDRQCEMMYGKGFKTCSYMNICSSLWCWDDEKMGSCYSNGMPPAEGTPCGHSHWCQQGECVPINREALKPVDGGWGPWQPFEECSRSCGGGIKRQFRNCDNPSPRNGGQFCLGRSVRYASCNFKECPIGTLDFRAEQCAKYNNNPLDSDLSSNVRWVPHYYGLQENPNANCKLLYCRAEGTPIYYDLQDKVIDGTTCGPNTYDMCVNGVCTKAGCDHILNSNSVLDSCGVCGGDNSTCKKVSKQFTLSNVTFGYNPVAVIPAGASNINIQLRPLHYAKDDNHLALVDVASGQYVLTRNFSITRYDKEIDYDGVTITYSGANASVERINTSQPLRKDLRLEVLSVRSLTPPEIVCEYTVPISPQNYFIWRVTEKWTACNKVCEGEQERIIRCIRKDTDNHVSEESCAGLPKPKTQVKVCNQHCVLKWNVVSQSECSSYCGRGFRNVTFGCFQEFTDNIFPRVQLPAISCRHIEKPSEKQTCFGACDTYHWKYGEWGSCNVSCGNGVQTREATCIDESQRIVDDAKCAAGEKIVEKLCIMQKCPLWTVGEWSRCSVSCGLGSRTRPVRCQQGNQLVHSYLCASDKKPTPVESCQMPACATVDLWTVGSWSDCSVSCGTGYRTRTVRCNRAEPNSCSDTTSKPTAQQICTLPDCSTSTTTQTNEIIQPSYYNSIQAPPFTWVSEDWQPCSSSCGIGERKRVVKCYSLKSRTFVDPLYCDSNAMPAVSESCLQTACSVATAEWKTTEWSTCSSSCGVGISVRNVWCEMNAKQVEEHNCIRHIKPDKTIACDTTENCRPSVSDVITSTTAIATVKLKASSAQTALPSSSTSHYSIWRTGKWGECSRSCGVGWKIRHVVCHDENGSEASDCDITSRPPVLMTCNVEPCEDSSTRTLVKTPKPIYRWTTSNWTTCSVTCGIGFQKRSMQCERILATSTEQSTSIQAEHERSIVSDEFCSEITPPSLQQECRLNYCSNDYVWIPEAWSECNASCGGKGKQRRKLACFHRSGRKVKKTYCRSQRKPIRRRHCILNKCEPSSCEDVKRKFKSYVDREYPLNILGRNISIYCHRMWSDSPAEYLTLTVDSDNENYSEFFAQSITTSNSNLKTCFEPAENWTNAKRSCPCLKESMFKSGKTSFQKLRLNITSLEVNTHDFTFSRQIYGSAVPYGEAADCYSLLTCAGGAFSINLKGTGLRVSPSTSWIKTGVDASMKMDSSNENRKVVAKCAGYCAACKPAQSLKLDILPP